MEKRGPSHLELHPPGHGARRRTQAEPLPELGPERGGGVRQRTDHRVQNARGRVRPAVDPGRGHHRHRQHHRAGLPLHPERVRPDHGQAAQAVQAAARGRESGHLRGQHRRGPRQGRLRGRLRLHAGRAGLRADRLLVAAEPLLAARPQLLHARPAGRRLQHRRPQLPVGRGGHLRREPVADRPRRLPHALLPPAQQQPRVRRVHQGAAGRAAVRRQLPRVPGAARARPAGPLHRRDHGRRGPAVLHAGRPERRGLLELAAALRPAEPGGGRAPRRGHDLSGRREGAARPALDHDGPHAAVPRVGGGPQLHRRQLPDTHGAGARRHRRHGLRQRPVRLLGQPSLVGPMMGSRRLRDLARTLSHFAAAALDAAGRWRTSALGRDFTGALVRILLLPVARSRSSSFSSTFANIVKQLIGSSGICTSFNFLSFTVCTPVSVKS